MYKKWFLVPVYSLGIVEPMDIFISHSSQDAVIVNALIELIRSALNIPASQIRCTSIEGFKLPGGTPTDQQIRREVFDCKVLLGVISPNSMQSVYVMFELGARWSIEKPMIPLATNHLSIAQLKGPLKGINTLDSSVSSDVFQLVTDIGNYLSITPEQPSVYQKKVEDLVRLSLEEALPPKLDIPVDTLRAQPSVPIASTTDDHAEYANAEQQIKQYCAGQWPGNYLMQANCIKTQKDAVMELKKGRPADIPEEVFAEIRKQAAIDWPEDFMMRHSAESTQIESYRALQNM